MAPTRELALQTTKECKKFAKLFNLRCVAVYGGTGISEQIVSLRKISCLHLEFLSLGGIETWSRNYCLYTWTYD